MAIWDEIKSDAVKNAENLLGDMFKYQQERLLNSPTLVRLRGTAPAGNLTEKELKQGARGDAGGIPTGNSNGDLSNSVTSPWVSSKMVYIIGGALLILIVVLIAKRK